jgi:hypothetical protein
MSVSPCLTGAAELNGCLGYVVGHVGLRAKVLIDRPEDANVSGNRIVAVKRGNLVVGPDRYCLPRHEMHIEPSFLAFNSVPYDVARTIRRSLESGRRHQWSDLVRLRADASRAAVGGMALRSFPVQLNPIVRSRV